MSVARTWLAVGVVAMATALAACGVVPSADAPPVPFPECEAEAFAFAGRSTLAALGLEDHWPEEAQVPADIWITAGPPDPADWPMPPGQAVAGRHLLCVELDDGSGMVGPLEEAWVSPGGAFDLDADGEGTPIAGIVAAAAALLVAGVSFLAFRGGSEGGGAAG